LIVDRYSAAAKCLERGGELSAERLDGADVER